MTWGPPSNDVSMRASKILAWNLRRLRVAHGVSQKRLAAHAEIARGYLARIERGLENPTLEMLDRIATALSTPMAEFFVAPGATDARRRRCAADVRESRRAIIAARPRGGRRPRELRLGNPEAAHVSRLGRRSSPGASLAVNRT